MQYEVAPISAKDKAILESQGTDTSLFPKGLIKVEPAAPAVSAPSSASTAVKPSESKIGDKPAQQIGQLPAMTADEPGYGQTGPSMQLGAGTGGRADAFSLYDVDEKDIIEIKERAMKVKRALEYEKPVKLKVRDAIEAPGKIPTIHLSYRHATIINLPYAIDSADRSIRIGDKNAFDIKVDENVLTIFPLRQFKSTNLIITTKGGSVHHYYLVEDSASETADAQVNIRSAAALPGKNETLTRLIMGNDVPDPDSLTGMMFEGREMSIQTGSGHPVLKKIVMKNPDYFVYLVDGKYVPTRGADWYSQVGNRKTVVATKEGSIDLRRVGDGETVTIR